MTCLSSSGRGVSFGGFSEEHGAAIERAQSVVNDPKGFGGADFDQIPVSRVIPCLMSQKLSSVLGEIRVFLGRPQSQKVTFGKSC